MRSCPLCADGRRYACALLLQQPLLLVALVRMRYVNVNANKSAPETTAVAAKQLQIHAYIRTYIHIYIGSMALAIMTVDWL